MKRSCIILACLVIPVSLALSSPQQSARTLQSFGVTVRHGQPVHPLPSNVALGLFNPEDPFLDVAYYANGRVQVFQNLGNGLFSDEPVFDRSVSGEVAAMRWQMRNPYFSSPSDLLITYTDGREETIANEWMREQTRSFASLPQMTSSFPPLNFTEKWRSQPNLGLGTQALVGDLDNDGRNELVYMFYPAWPDSVYRLVVYECVGNDSFVVDWDTTTTTITGLFGISDIDNDGHKEIITVYFPRPAINILPVVALFECFGPRQYRFYTTNIGFQRPIFKVTEADVNHNGVKDLVVLTSNGSISYDNTFIYVAEFVVKGRSPQSPSGWMMGFNQELARCDFYVTDMAVGQVNGIGRDEIVLGTGGTLGITGPLPILYMWYNGVPGPFAWEVRRINTGLRSDDGAPMFVNLDADTTKEFVAGGAGPPGHGSMFAIKYLHDTTWSVLWADSSLRNGPLWVNAGWLQNELVVAGANTWAPRFDTVSSQLHVYYPSGTKRGVWVNDDHSIQQFHLLDIDLDGTSNLIFASLGGLRTGYDRRLKDYESDTIVAGIGASDVPEQFELFQNYPNPFNSNTTIAFALTVSARVTLTIYNILGEEVKTLINQHMERGKHVTIWNGTNDNGNDVSSGMYLYRFVASDARGTLFTSTKKTMLLR